MKRIVLTALAAGSGVLATLAWAPAHAGWMDKAVWRDADRPIVDAAALSQTAGDAQSGDMVLAQLRLPAADAVTPSGAFRHHHHVATRRLTIPASNQGHYFIQAEVGHKRPGYGRTRMNFLVDTGASRVSMSWRQANSMGFRFKENDYNQVALTANGQVRAAHVTLPEVRIGSLSFRNVPGAFIQSNVQPLLGMSFLSRLKRYSIQNNVMVWEY